MNWPEKAEELGRQIGQSRLHARVVDLLESSECPVGVACSGGLDSLTALLLVFTHFPGLRSRLTVLHLNHALRGKSSDEDAAFVTEVAGALGLPIQSSVWTDRDPEQPVSEAQAREARQALFDDFAATEGSGLIVVGHHKDDILESLMLRIARSSNLGGLSAPKPVSAFASGKTIVRPLLNLSKDTLRSAMTAAGIGWREDASNLECTFDRNWLRNEVIPLWQSGTQFDLSQAAAQVREYLEEANEVMDRYMTFSRYPPPECNPAHLPLRLGPKGLLRRWIYLWLREQNLLDSFQPSTISEMLMVLMAAGRGQWSGGQGFITIEGSLLKWAKSPVESLVLTEAKPLKPGCDVLLPTGYRLTIEQLQPSQDLLENLKQGKYSELLTVLIDSDSLPQNSLLVRAWLPGDRYRPLNAPGTRKLQDMFVDRKIPREERNLLPVVITPDSLILWCPGLPVNHAYRVTEKTKQILQLTYTCLH